MEKLTLHEIIEVVKGKLIVQGTDNEYINVSTDTRNIKDKSIFIALKGEKFNGNDFVVDASNKGANLCIISEKNFDKNLLNPKTSVVLVDNTYESLLELAKYYRKKLNIKVVGITGSTGKTSTKDFVSAVLSKKYKVFKTHKNYNNHIGLPLMVLSLDNSYDVAVLEMGMSNFGEIHKLADVARPNIAIITNIGISHIENLKTQENILKAKMEITDFFSKDNILIVNNDDKYLSKVSSRNYKVIKTSIEHDSNYKAENILIYEDSISFDVIINGKLSIKDIKVNAVGKHNVYNSLMAIACGDILNVSNDNIKGALRNVEKTSMRLEIIKGKEFTIINDCYNASPDSTKAAIDVVCNLSGKRKIAVLGTMKELGEKSFDAHFEVARYARDKKIDYLFTLGEFNEAFQKGFGKINFKEFKNKHELINYLKIILRHDDIVLVKASRYMKFEEIVSELKKIN